MVSPAITHLPAFEAAVQSVLQECDIVSAVTPPARKDSQYPTIDVCALARDFGTLLHSHCTKLSLAARPPKTPEAIASCINDMTELLPACNSLVKLLNREIHGSSICDLIRNQARYALIGLRSMVQAVTSGTDVEGRLSKTGILWEACSELQNVGSLSKTTSKRVKECAQMLGDAIDDLESWAAGESDDNFDTFEDSASETSSEIEDKSSATVPVDQEIQRRISMLTRVQLLLKALDKRRITENISVTSSNAIYDSIIPLSAEVDDLAGEIQEGADPAYIMEMEKVVVHRVEELLTASLLGNDDKKWVEWVTNFRKRWREDGKKDTKRGVVCYDRPLHYSDFLHRHLKSLTPCIMRGLATDWKCTQEWCKMDQEGVFVPHYKLLRERYGDLLVTVTQADKSETRKLPFAQFLTDMEGGNKDYARDIHIIREFPSHDIYQCPELFQDDWLNFQLVSEGRDDYKFMYIGGHDTRTKLHKDVVASHSWSTNLTGTKEWVLIPPGKAEHLMTSDCEEVVSDIYLDDSITRARWPNLQRVRDAAILVMQQPGETIFVPSTWYHQVRNIGPTMSINHNWINTASLEAIYHNLANEVAMSVEAVVDLKDDGILDDAGFARVIEDLTLANAGMNWDTFFDMILFRFEHASEYIPAAYRPSRALEDGVVAGICEKWSSSNEANHLPEVSVKVGKISALLSVPCKG